MNVPWSSSRIQVYMKTVRAIYPSLRNKKQLINNKLLTVNNCCGLDIKYLICNSFFILKGELL